MLRVAGDVFRLANEHAMISSKDALDPRTRITGQILMIALFAFNFGAVVTLNIDKTNLSKWDLTSLSASAFSLIIGLFIVLRNIWKSNAASRPA